MAGPAYQWGSWRFEPSECRLLRDGVVVPLPAKSLDLLATLLKRAPRLVSKEEILAAVWPDATVEEGNIAFHVAALRKALDDGDAPSVIETVRGRGYRFVREIAIHQLPPTDALQRDALERAMAAKMASTPGATARALPPRSPADRRRRLIAVVAIVMISGLGALAWWQTLPGAAAIAIQPFEIVDPPQGQENFPDGLRTYLTTKLRLAGIAVAPDGIVRAALSGQLHPMDGGFRVTVQLTRTGDNARVWDWSFDVPADANKPPAGAGPDDERSRLQGAIADRVTEGLQRYLSLSGVVPVTR